MDNNFRIDFIGIGVAKAGTTWIADKLRLHPELFIPEKKELFYFNDINDEYEPVANYRHTKSLDWYHDYFSNATQKQLCGEISNPYLHIPNAAEAIYRYNPHLKLFAILREPVSRAYSHYLYNVHRHHVNYPPFEESIRQKSSFLEQGFYYKHLSRYLTYFDASQIKIMFYDDLQQDMETFYTELLQFLGVSIFIPQNLTEKSNETKTARFPWINKSLDKIRYQLHQNNLHAILPLLRKTGIIPLAEYIRDKANAKKMQAQTTILAEDTQKRLREMYLSDIENLEKLTQRDLSAWK
ncbi:MAG: sulfotransferase domain-containing protein [Chitinophagales bacterium]|nr:sulfotransferase domain-containing protein [Bacteroidota bacterium]